MRQIVNALGFAEIALFEMTGNRPSAGLSREDRAMLEQALFHVREAQAQIVEAGLAIQGKAKL